MQGKGLTMKSIRWLAFFFLAAALAPAKTDPKTERELMAAMDVLKDATINKDVAAFTRLIDPDITYSHSSGLTMDRAVLLDYVPTMNTVYIKYSDTDIRVYGNLAVVKNITDIRGAGSENNPFLLNALYVWVKGPQGWRLLARQVISLRNLNAPNRGGRGAAGAAVPKQN